MSQLGQYYINEHDELGMLTDYPDGDVAVVSWYRRSDKGEFGYLSGAELRYLPYLTPIEDVVADIMLGGN